MSIEKAPVNKKKKKVLSPAEKELARRKKSLHDNILTIFKSMGFEYIDTDNIKKEFGGLKSDIDNTFLFNNIILLCEETVSEKDKDHLRKKYDYFEKILGSPNELISWLKQLAPDKFDKFDKFSVSRYKIFYLYISNHGVDQDTKNSYNKFKFVDEKDLKYFKLISNCLKYTARNELYKFLGIDLDQVGHPSSGKNEKDIASAVIIPESSSGFPDGIQLVSFAMKAKELMDCAYVFRKDSWENKIGLYQRLIDQSKIDRIRKFLFVKKRTFIDNIIVSLPSDVKFSKLNKSTNEEEMINIFEADDISNVNIKIPYKINSIGIIDGQHRIYGHYEGYDNKEEEIKKLREKRHLLVTGLCYDKKYKEADKRKFESELFLQINNEQKKVDKALLQYIQSLQDPYSPIGLSNNVLNALNRKSNFLNLFLMSPLEKKGIRTPTIIQYGLHDLLEISDEKETIFKYWKNDKKNLLKEENGSEDTDKIYEEYINFCVNVIDQYFSAVKSNFQNFWIVSNESKLLSVTSIVAFLISFRKSFEVYNEIKDFHFYKEKLKELKIDFSKDKFPYVSSQWPKFVDEIKKCWN